MDISKNHSAATNSSWQKQIDDLAMFKIAVEQVYNHVVITDTNARITFVNKAAETITGYLSEEMIGKTPRLWGGQMDESFYKTLWQTIKFEQKPFHGEIQNKRKNGELYYAILTITPLKDSQGALKGFIAVEEDITRLKEIDKLKDDFLSLASHELRTPLTEIRWFAERLAKKDTDASRLSIIEKIAISNKHMIDLVNVLLNISRIESGRLTISSVPTRVADLVTQALSEANIKYANKKQSVLVEIQPNLPQLQTDPELVGRVMVNLIMNAMRYSPESTKIKITLSMHQDSLVFTVQDHGYGIPQSAQEHIFSRFYRAENIITKVTDGSGLGLYLSKIICKELNADLTFQSQENSGTTFTFSMPLKGISAKKGEVSLQPI
jgi:PAS domain S-box-containing protein